MQSTMSPRVSLSLLVGTSDPIRLLLSPPPLHHLWVVGPFTMSLARLA